MRLRWVLCGGLLASFLLIFALVARKINMPNHAKIVAEVDKEVIQRFGFSSVQVSTVSDATHQVRTKPDGQPREWEDPVGNEERTKECVFRDGNRVLRISLQLHQRSIKTAKLAATPDANDAAKLWADLIRTRIPGIEILFTGEPP